MVVAIPLSSSSEKEDDIVSGGDEVETACVDKKTFATSRQGKMKMPKSLQVNSNGHEEMR